MIKTSRKYIVLFLTILFLSISLRFGLVSYNRQANDPHDEVIKMIMETGKLPEKDDCWECFQPKLFHYTAAKILQIPWIASIQNISLPYAVELINFFAGILTLLVVGLFITHLPVKSEALKLLAFGLVALNPQLIGINSQFTNDTFAILFATLALYCMFLYLKKQKLSTFLFALLFSILGVSSKTNIWVIAIAVFMAMLIKTWTQKKNFVFLGLGFIAAVLILSTLNPLNQYIQNYQKHGSPLVLNMDKKPFPNFFQKTEAARPGILSIYDGLFTFKFPDLLSHPLIDLGDEVPPIRTSLWTLLYGRAHSIHFSNYPPTWSTTDEKGFNLTRAIFILALLPTLFLLFGFILETLLLLRSIFKRDNALASRTTYGLAAITFVGYICFIILYALLYRDFSVMKTIFIYPALLCFPVFFIRAGEFFKKLLNTHFQWVFTVFTVWIVALFVLYTADIITMIQLISSQSA